VAGAIRRCDGDVGGLLAFLETNSLWKCSELVWRHRLCPFAFGACLVVSSSIDVSLSVGDSSFVSSLAGGSCCLASQPIQTAATMTTIDNTAAFCMKTPDWHCQLYRMFRRPSLHVSFEVDAAAIRMLGTFVSR
jgi:hypothetical protein